MGIDLSGDVLELLLVAPQIRKANLEQAIDGNVYHLVIKQFLAKSFRAKSESRRGMLAINPSA